MYVPLRTHGYHSLLTGVDSPAVLVRRARELGLPALALTDVDNVAGLTDFLEAAEAEGVRPIVGAELSDRSGGEGRVIVLVKDEQGYRNMCRLVTWQHLPEGVTEGGFGLPSTQKKSAASPSAQAEGDDEDDEFEDDEWPLDFVQTLVAHKEGLVFLVDHPRLLLELFGRLSETQLFAAIAPSCLRLGSQRDPRSVHGRARNTHLASAPHPAVEASSAEDNSPLSLEDLQASKTPDPGRPVPAASLIDAARAIGVATVAVPDVYWALASDAPEHRVRVAIKHNALLSQLPNEWLASEPGHLMSFEEMCSAYAQLPDVPGPFAAAQGALRARYETKRKGSGAPRPGAVLPGAVLPDAVLPDAVLPGAVLPGAVLPGAVLRTVLIADSCRYTPPLGGVIFPEIELDADESAYSKLCQLTFDGARRRYRPLRPEVLRRLDYELSVIHQLGYAPYFLLVDRIANFAKDEGIPCVGRGSAADSLVAYCLALTDADPFRYRLPFERFLNPERRDRPDIDLDFCWRRRDEVLEHVYKLFGTERTAMICTLNRFGMRSAFREAALVQGIPPAEIGRWSRRLPMFPPQPYAGTPAEEEAEERNENSTPRHAQPAAEASLRSDSEPADFDESPQGTGAGSTGHPAATQDSVPASRTGPASPSVPYDNPIAASLRSIPEARHFPFDDARFTNAMQSAARLLDVPRHFGLHPGGVVVAPGEIRDLVACQRAAKGPIVTQLDKNGVEAIGLVKMDLLGNRALTVLDDSCRMLAKRGVPIDLEAIDERDPATACSLREGRTLGCFQIESPGMRNLLQQTGAADMDAVIQAIALIRPGPAGSGMKDAYIRRFRGLEDPTPPHPALVDVLWDTFGVMLYQEDVMQAASRVAGMELAEADELRRALQKSRGDALAKLRERFLDGCARRAGAEAEAEAEQAEQLWELIANFSSFAFCKAHAVTYGRIAYRAAWLKTHHPAIYMVAFLASYTGYYPQRVYIEEARRLGVRILRPDINKSSASFTVEWIGDNAALRVGLSQVKGFGQHSLDRLVASRESAGPYLSLPDLLKRTQLHTDEALNLIQCGALDSFDRTRPELAWRLHLLRTQQLRAPRAQAGERGLDPDQLAACRRASGQLDPIEHARARAEGWSGKGLGITGADLKVGESAMLFPEPPAPALALPRLPDPSPLEMGRLEFDLLGLTIDSHPVQLFPCEGEERIRRRFGNGMLPVHGRFFSRSQSVNDNTVSHTLLLPGQSPGAATHQRSNDSVGCDPRELTGQQQGVRHRIVSAPAVEAADLRPVNPTPCGRLRHYRGGRITLRGWPAATRRVRTSKGELMRFLTLEDESGLAEVVLFPDTYRRDGEYLNSFGPLCITGIVEDQMGACTLHAERIW